MGCSSSPGRGLAAGRRKSLMELELGKGTLATIGLVFNAIHDIFDVDHRGISLEFLHLLYRWESHCRKSFVGYSLFSEDLKLEKTEVGDGSLYGDFGLKK
jgi:hypothetical protein